MKKIEFVSAQHVKVEYELASTFQRVVAALIDFCVLFLYSFLIIIAFDISNVFRIDNLLFMLLVIQLPWVLYYPVFEFFNKGQTIGKMAVGIRAVKTNGEILGAKEIAIKWLFRGDFIWLRPDLLVFIWIGVALFGMVISATSLKNQRLGDLIAGILIVKTKPNVSYSLQNVLSIKSQEKYAPLYPNVIQFTDEDMLLIKNALIRLKNFPNKETKLFLIELTNETARIMGLKTIPEKKEEFLQRVLDDYVVLTR
jgi:uncharacterized RDD family membrane protein YckC